MENIWPRMPVQRKKRTTDTAFAAATTTRVEDSSDSDSDEEFHSEAPREAVQQAGPRFDISAVMQSAQVGRIKARTRSGYEGQLRQMARWAQGIDEFKHCVSADGKMATPLEEACMVAYTEHLKIRQVNWPHHPVPGTTKHLAVKTICSWFAAAKDTFAFHGKCFPDDVDAYFGNFIRGYTLFIASQKDKGLHPDKTNSTGFSRSVYERICRKSCAYVQDGKGSCTSAWRQVWLFWLFLYNLLGRVTQVSKILYDWIWWQDDAMVIKVPTQKGDQDGLLSYWKRVYANPLNPSLCPVLALAVHVFSITPADPFSNRVFATSANTFREQFIRFMTWAFPEKMLEGIHISRFTSHSPKRSGMCFVNGVEVIKWDSTELRADHKLGLISSYQTCPAPQQDGTMGRLLAGLDFASPEFNVAPPHFLEEDTAKIPFEDIVANYDSYSATFKTVLPFLLASIVFHFNSGQLRSILPKKHPLWSSTLVLRKSKLLNDLSTKVLGGKVGAKSILVLSGNSVAGDTRTDVAEIRRDVAVIKSTVTTLVSKVGGVVDHPGSVEIGGGRFQEQLTDIQEQLRYVRQKLDHESDVVAAAGAQVVMPRRCIPVFYLSNSFTLSSCTPFNLLTRWVTPEPPAPAWRHIRNEMLPRTEGRRAQENLLSVYTNFMQAFLGNNPNFSDVEANIEGFFQVAWARMARVYGWGSEKSPTCSTKTVYNWLLQHRENFQQLKDCKVVTSMSFAAEAASSARQQRETARSREQWTQLECVPSPQSIAVVERLVQPAACVPSPQSIAVIERLVQPAACVPRNALLYPSEAPRPPAPRTPNPVNDGVFDSYLALNAPKPGARPCWSCPFCLTSRHFPVLANLYRHVRTAHEDASEEQRQLVMSQSDIACLVWCTTRDLGTSQGKWEPILQ